MIGFLCSEKREEAIVRALSATLKPMLDRANESALFFTLQNASIEKRAATGTLLKDYTTSTGGFSLPSVIVNFSQQRKYADIRKMRALSEVSGITLYNAVNRYNQAAVASMLMSEESTSKFLLPSLTFHIPEAKSVKSSFINLPQTFILKPDNSTARSKVLYCKKQGDSVQITGIAQQNFALQDFFAFVKSLHRSKNWRIYRTADLFTYENRLFTTRIFAQRDPQGNWLPLQQSGTDNLSNLLRAIESRALPAVQAIAEGIHCFIPAVLFCFVDLVFDSAGQAFFLGFGGWRDDLILRREEPKLKEAVCRNILTINARSGRHGA